MPLATSAGSVSKGALWTGRIVQALVVLFLLFDAITKIMKIAPVMQAFARLGYPQRLAPVIGTILLICTVIYIIPRTSILGAVLLAAYLGGAVEVNLRAGDPVFETIFPIIFGVLVWGALYLREPRLRALIPLRTAAAR
jgi:hypothetical protein